MKDKDEAALRAGSPDERYDMLARELGLDDEDVEIREVLYHWLRLFDRAAEARGRADGLMAAVRAGEIAWDEEIARPHGMPASAIMAAIRDLALEARNAPQAPTDSPSAVLPKV